MVAFIIMLKIGFAKVLVYRLYCFEVVWLYFSVGLRPTTYDLEHKKYQRMQQKQRCQYAK